MILVNISRSMVGNQSKFTPSWHGPHEIIEIVEKDEVYKMQEIGSESHQ